MPVYRRLGKTVADPADLVGWQRPPTAGRPADRRTGHVLSATVVPAGRRVRRSPSPTADTTKGCRVRSGSRVAASSRTAGPAPDHWRSPAGRRVR